MDTLIFANVIFFGWALVESLRKISNGYSRKWMRVPAIFISAYIFAVYFAAMMGWIPEFEIRYYLRWFNLVIAMYIVLESKHA